MLLGIIALLIVTNIITAIYCAKSSPDILFLGNGQSDGGVAPANRWVARLVATNRAGEYAMSTTKFGGGRHPSREPHTDSLQEARVFHRLGDIPSGYHAVPVIIVADEESGW